MRYNAAFLLLALTFHPTPTACGEVAVPVAIEQELSNIAPFTITPSKSDPQFATTVAPSGTEPSLVILAPSLTTPPVTTSVATLPTLSSSSLTGGRDETSNSGTAGVSSTITITISRNRTTTIRPTVTVTSLFSSVGSTTSGASGRQETLWGSVSGLICILLFTLSLSAYWF